MIKLKLALDWTPNINHIGFLIAKELGFYKQQGIDLEILNPQER
jgi:ABC-type nitrate/sulfonate/bicarbonate transport system substrate-binding protein